MARRGILHDDDNDDANREINRLFDLYESNSKNFQKVFAILVGFGLFFFFTAIIPYFSNQFEQHRHDLRIGQETKIIKDENDTINSLHNKIVSTKDEIKMTGSVTDMIKANAKEELKDATGSLSKAKLLIAMINDPRVISELNKILNSTSSEQKRVQVFVDTALKTYQDQYNQYVRRIGDLNGNLSILQQTEKNEIGNRKNDLAMKGNLVRGLEKLNVEWNQIKSPFGDIPIKFTDLLAVFPISMAAGFLICMFFLSEAIQLRGVLHQIYQKKDQNNTVIDERRIYLIAPLWLDPINPRQNRYVQFSILLLPFVIFVASICMILYSWYIASNSSNVPFPAASDLDTTIYLGLYTLSFGIFVYGCVHLITEISRYPKE